MRSEGGEAPSPCLPPAPLVPPAPLCSYTPGAKMKLRIFHPQGHAFKGFLVGVVSVNLLGSRIRRNGFPHTPKKNELVLSIKTGCACTVPVQPKPNTPF